jgi:hypothetical protein
VIYVIERVPLKRLAFELNEGAHHEGGGSMSRLSAAPPVLPPGEVDTLAERWLKRIKSNPLIAALIVF